MRCFARSSACSSMAARLLWPSDEIGRARLRPAARADRAASRRRAGTPRGCSSTTAPRAPSATGRSPTCRTSSPASSSSSTTRRSCPRGCTSSARRGGDAEVLLLEPLGGGVWEALARPSRRLRVGERLGPVELLESLGEGRWRVRLDGEPDGRAAAAAVHPRAARRARALPDGLRGRPRLGRRADRRAPLHAGAAGPARRRAGHPPRRARHLPAARRRRARGARAARRALPRRARGVGEDRGGRAGARRRHDDRPRARDDRPRRAPRGPNVALRPARGSTFRRVDALLTNFHLPRSTLLALVMAFAGVDAVRDLYRLAIEERYRFYSFGDAMLIL